MKKIKEFPNYYVTDKGEIYNSVTNIYKAIQTNYKNGYQSVILYDNNRYKRLYIHRLVALAYLDNPLNKEEVNHINGNKSDNRIENLEWVTKSENNLHSWRTRTTKQYLSKMVLNIKTGIYYDSIKEASDYNSINYGTLKNRLRLKQDCDFVLV